MSILDFNEILLGNAEFLRPFAINLTKDSETAEDLYQNTLYKALSNKDKYHSGTNIRAWLYTIMRNIFINEYRRKVKQKTIFDSSPNDFLINHNQATISNAAESNIRIKEIRKHIKELPEIFKTPFLLYCDGYRYNEIAEALEQPLGTIKSRIHFARKLLKQQLSRF